MHSTEKYLNKVKKLTDELGRAGAAKKLGIKRETLKRRLRELRERIEGKGKQFDQKIFQDLRARYSDSELKRLAAGALIVPEQPTFHHEFKGERLMIGLISDTHLGSIYTNPDFLFAAFDEFRRKEVNFICHTGDVTEGSSHRAGHQFECSHIGYSRQLEHARDIFQVWDDTAIYMIDGNHDRWYIKGVGANIVKELCSSMDNLEYLGHDEGNININGITIKLWHGEDGSSYAFTYRTQKIVESLTGGEKPNVLLCGHTHKAFYVFDRHIHCMSAGAIQKQSKWMRGKRHQSHTGFWVIEMLLGDSGVISFKPEWFPFYR